MPKDKFDFDDPMELNGVGLACNEDTTEAMTECFVEEFMRLGYSAKQILGLFHSPHYIGMHMALEKRGEQFVKDKIAEVFTRRGKPVAWPTARENPLTPALSPSEGERENRLPSTREPATADCGSRQVISPEHPTLFPLPRRGGEGQGEGENCAPSSAPEQIIALEATITDPMGVPVPKLNL
jgi:hypothetical protein